MTLSQALEAVGAFYAPGVARYFGALNPDPWMQIHEDLEQTALYAPEGVPDAADAFVRKARELVDRFRREGTPTKHVSPHDAFNMGNVEHVKAIQSVKHHECYRCGGKEKLKLEAYGPQALQVRVICEACKAGDHV